MCVQTGIYLDGSALPYTIMVIKSREGSLKSMVTLGNTYESYLNLSLVVGIYGT